MSALIERARHEVAEDRRIAALARQQRTKDVLLQRAQVTEDLIGVVERLKCERREFTAVLDFGDDIHEPAASLADMVDPIKTAFMEAQDHWECPRYCGNCGERLASTECPKCHGSGCGPGTASGAYDPCGDCGGEGWLHEGCAAMSYADLVAEVARLKEELHACHGTISGLHSHIGQLEMERRP